MEIKTQDSQLLRMAKRDWRKHKITLSASRMEEDAILAQKKFIIEEEEPALIGDGDATSSRA